MIKSELRVPSENLIILRQIFAENSFLTGLGKAQQLRLIIDTNVILRDLIRLAKHSSPSLRTCLQEVVASKTVVAFAPETLRHEVQKHLSKLAIKKKIPETRLREEWEKYQNILHFYSTPPLALAPCKSIRDPTDLPFIYLYGQVGAAAVYTNDKDIGAMGVPTVTLDVIISLKNYSRSTTLELTIKLGGVTIMIGGIGIFFLLFKLVRTFLQSLIRLPRQIQIASLIILVIALTHPKGRKFFKDVFNSLESTFISSVNFLAPIFQQLGEIMLESEKEAKAHWGEVEDSLHSKTKIQLRTLIFSVCLAAEKPLSINEIEQGVRDAGYQPKSKYFKTYIRKILRKSHQIVELPGPVWTVLRNE